MEYQHLSRTEDMEEKREKDRLTDKEERKRGRR